MSSDNIRVSTSQSLAFAGSGLLARRAELRGDGAALARMRADPACQVLLFWRGRPLLRPEGLGGLPGTHPVLDAQPGPEIFLGLTGEAPVFARDISDFEPEGPLPAGAAFFDASEQRHPLLPETDVFAELRGAMARLTPLEAEIAASARGLFEWHRSHRFCAACGHPSEMIEAGWVRRCPDCGRQHFPRTDPVVIMLITKGNQLLLGRSPNWPEGMYSTLAGFMEPGETIAAAVRREVAEETGVRVGPVRFIASQPWPFPTSLMLGCHGEAESHEITIDPVEIEDALWISRERLLDVVAGRDPVIRPPRPGAIAGWLMRQWLADRLD